MLYFISQLVSFTMRAFASGVLPSGPLMPSSLRTLLTMLGVISSVLDLPGSPVLDLPSRKCPSTNSRW
jgi:hypothetical protein